jgi:hypothetical protein
VEAVKKRKKLYRGVFNYNRVVTAQYAYAYTERQAWAIMCKRLAERDGVGVLTVMQKFDGKADNYEIKEWGGENEHYQDKRQARI